MPEPITIRVANKSDAALLAITAEATFRDSFAYANTEADMNAHCTKKFGAAQQLAEIQDPKMLTILVEAGTSLIAFGQLREGSAPACVQGLNPREILRLYVDRSWHGKGIAQTLMSELIDRAVQAGADSVWLGVWESNPRAIAFYNKSGFRAVGDHTFWLGSEKQRDVVMEYRPAAGEQLSVS